MNHSHSILFSLLLISFTVFSQDEKTLDAVRNDVEHLAHDRMKGREAGTKHEKAAADYIAKRFKSIGLTSFSQYDDYLQHFTFKEKANPHDDKAKETVYEAVNVVGYINNGSTNNSVIIGAHFDHLGMGEFGSFSETKEIHNGADDNASGVAAMLYLAEKLKEGKWKRNNYVFVAFTGEEKGLYGSNYFLKDPPFYLNKMNYMINLDMVGRLNPEKGFIVNGVGTSPIWKTTLSHANTNNMKYVTGESGTGPSDHTSFYLKDIPALHFFTGSHEDYHRPTDDPEKINYEGIVQISDLILNVIGDLNPKLKLAFTRTADEDNGSGVPAFKVTLGVIPDYLFDGKGMRIEGVKEDRPAQKAGIIAGDIVTRIGEVEVINMKTYMEGLSKFEKGSKTKVSVKREGKDLEFDVQF